MMKKEMDNLFSRVLYLPWWTSAAFGAVLVLGFDFGLPRIEFQTQSLHAVVGAAALIAPAIAALALAVSAISFSRYLGYAQWLDAQSGNLSYIRTFRWRRYESVLRAVYEKQGFRVIKPRRDAPYASVDILLRKGREQYLVCCRHWRAKIVGVKTVRALFENMGNRSAAGGIVATCGTFTEEARHFAKGWNIELIDGSGVQKMIHAARAETSSSEAAAKRERRSDMPAGKAPQPVVDVSAHNNVIVLYPETLSAALKPDEGIPHVVSQAR